MAKTIMPLASARASGQLAKMLVYFGWKGLNVVRGYVIPSNPNTAGQQAQRTVFTNAVDKWHDTAMIALDKTAWNLFATTFAEIMSGFNVFVKKFIEGALLGTVWQKVYNAVFTDQAAGHLQLVVDTDDTLAALKLRYGESKTFMPNTINSSGAGASQTFDITPLVDGVTYYIQVYTDAASSDCWTGIYRHTYVAP
jgi:hypothetical protein